MFYSHLGQPGGDDGDDLLLIPLNLKAGYTFSDVVRVAVHGGLSLNYISSPQQATTTVTTPTSTVTTSRTFRETDWDTNTNIGLDLEFGLGQDVLLLLRPDWTFFENDDAFTGTLGIGFPLS